MIARIPAKPKIERIAAIPKGPPRCGPASWHELIVAMNGKPDRVLVNRDIMQEVLECHDARDGCRPDLKAEASGRKYVIVDRMALMAFVQSHGRIRCDANH